MAYHTIKQRSIHILCLIPVVILLLLSGNISVAFAQDPPPAPEPVPCFSACGEAVFSSYSYTTNVDNTSGCAVTIRYKTRYCPLSGTWDVEVESIAFANSSCALLSAGYILDRVLYILTQSTILNFPPYSNDTSSVYRWRVARPSCLRNQADTLVRCGDNCCINDFMVRIRCEGVRQFIETHSIMPSQCEPTVQEDCIYVCNRRFWEVDIPSGIENP